MRGRGRGPAVQSHHAAHLLVASAKFDLRDGNYPSALLNNMMSSPHAFSAASWLYT